MSASIFHVYIHHLVNHMISVSHSMVNQLYNLDNELDERLAVLSVYITVPLFNFTAGSIYNL
jgi:hypothetical protein